MSTTVVDLSTKQKLLAVRRKRLGLSQAQLAKLLGVSRDALARYETSGQSLKYERLFQLDGALKMLERNKNFFIPTACA